MKMRFIKLLEVVDAKMQVHRAIKTTVGVQNEKNPMDIVSTNI